MHMAEKRNLLIQICNIRIVWFAAFGKDQRRLEGDTLELARPQAPVCGGPCIARREPLLCREIA
jgi:hypothetical protein